MSHSIFLMRHGIAEPFGQRPDWQRALTERGRLLLQRQFQARQSLLAPVQQIIHSPYLRTEETAQLAATLLGITTLQADERLTPDADPKAALSLLEEMFETPTLYVTHNPFVGRLIGLLCEGSAHQVIPMDTGMLAQVDCDWPAAGLGELRHQWAAPSM